MFMLFQLLLNLSIPQMLTISLLETLGQIKLCKRLNCNKEKRAKIVHFIYCFLVCLCKLECTLHGQTVTPMASHPLFLARSQKPSNVKWLSNMVLLLCLRSKTLI